MHQNATASLGGVKRNKIKAGDDAKTVSATFKGPEEIAVLFGSGLDDFTVGEDDLWESCFSSRQHRHRHVAI